MFTNGLLYAWQCSFNTQLPLKDPMSADEREALLQKLLAKKEAD